jgi:SSS family solute:Na+ symporter
VPPTPRAIILTTLAESRFAALDWAVVAGYLLLLLISGIWFARREPSGAREYFLAGRRMPAWAVACSVIASSLSVATFLGAPQIAYDGNLTYLSANLGNVLAVVVVAIFFIPVFYKHDCATIYELLEIRFGPLAKHAASLAFMVGRVFASGARVYIAAIPLAMILFGLEASNQPLPLIAAIAVLCTVGVLYTLVGGIASVIWTDVLQTLVLLVAVGAALLLLISRVPAPLGEVFTALGSGMPDGSSKLTVFTLGIDPAKPGLGFDPDAAFTVLTAILGWSLVNMAAYGTDHDLAQRMLTCKSAAQGSRSAIVAILLSIPIVLLFSVIGLMLWVFYQRPDLMGAASPGQAPTGSDRIFLAFILTQLPPGLSGLMVAGLFAVALGSLNSAINAMAATSVRDFYQHARPGRSDRHYMLAGRWASAGWGLVLALFACLCIRWRGETALIEFALKVMTFAYSGLLAVFLTALFTRRGNSASVVAALFTGFVVVAAFEPWSPLRQLLPTGEGGAGGAGGAPFRLAAPWVMLIATAAALAVCALPRGKGGPAADASAAR